MSTIIFFYLIEYQMEFLIHQNKLLMVQVYPKQRLNFKTKINQSKNSVKLEQTYDRANFKSLANATLGDKQ